MASFLDMVVSAFAADAANVQRVSELAKKAVRKAYTSKEGGLVLVQVMLDHMTRNYRDSLPSFFRKAGINITVDPGKPAIVGGVLDQSKQSKVFEWLDKADTLVCDPEAVIKQPRKPRKDAATWADAVKAAQKTIDSALAHAKKDRPEVFNAMQTLIARPAWFAKFAALDMSEEEVDAMIEGLLEARKAETAELLRKAA